MASDSSGTAAAGMSIDDDTGFHRLTGDGAAVVTVDTSLYSPQSVRKAAHRLTGLCYVHLQRSGVPDLDLAEPVGSAHENLTAAGNGVPEGRLLRVRLRPKPPAVTDIAALAGEFVNLLLDETLREEIGRETEPVRNLILAHALSETALLRPELETADPEADPLGIAEPDLVRQRTR